MLSPSSTRLPPSCASKLSRASRVSYDTSDTNKLKESERENDREKEKERKLGRKRKKWDRQRESPTYTAACMRLSSPADVTRASSPLNMPLDILQGVSYLLDGARVLSTACMCLLGQLHAQHAHDALDPELAERWYRAALHQKLVKREMIDPLHPSR